MKKQLNPLGEFLVIFFTCGLLFPVAIYGSWLITGFILWLWSN